MTTTTTEMEQPPNIDNWQILPGKLQHETSDGQSLTRKLARARALVLSARMIPHVIDRSTGVQQICVPPEYYSEALRQLRLHTNENRNWPPLPPEIMAPACPILLPGGAVIPATKPTIGF